MQYKTNYTKNLKYKIKCLKEVMLYLNIHKRKKAKVKLQDLEKELKKVTR